MSHSCEFSYLHDKNTLSDIKITHRFSSYQDSSNDDVVLRHDVNYSLESAVRMVEIEKQLKVRLTYFISFLQLINIKSHILTN